MVLVTLKFGNLGLVFVCLIYFDLVLRKKNHLVCISFLYLNQAEGLIGCCISYLFLCSKLSWKLEVYVTSWCYLSSDGSRKWS